MARPTHLKALQVIELAVRLGSLGDAAQELGITPAAAGQRIKGLEDYLGLTLLRRGRGGFGPSPELDAALPHLHRAFAELEAAARELDLQRVHEIHLAAPSDFVELWLEPRLAAFRALHPSMLFCINGAGEVPMRLGRVDCVIDFSRPPQPADGLSELLFHDFVLPIASPANVARVASLSPDAGLEGFPLLHLDFYKDDPAGLSFPEWIARNGIARTAPERGMRFQRMTSAIDAVEANAGVCLSGLALILDRIGARTIELPYPVTTGRWSEFSFNARFRADTSARQHVTHFRSWLSREAAKTTRCLINLLDDLGGASAPRRSRPSRHAK